MHKMQKLYWPPRRGHHAPPSGKDWRHPWAPSSNEWDPYSSTPSKRSKLKKNDNFYFQLLFVITIYEKKFILLSEDKTLYL